MSVTDHIRKLLERRGVCRHRNSNNASNQWSSLEIQPHVGYTEYCVFVEKSISASQNAVPTLVLVSTSETATWDKHRSLLYWDMHFLMTTIEHFPTLELAVLCSLLACTERQLKYTSLATAAWIRKRASHIQVGEQQLDMLWWFQCLDESDVCLLVACYLD